jgi:hypothetical protein
VVTVAVLAIAGPASATVFTHKCNSSGLMCVYYNSSAYGYGAEYGTSAAVYSFNPSYNGGDTYEFEAGHFGSAGSGWSIWNQAGGAADYSASVNMGVFQDHGYVGPVQTVIASSIVSLNSQLHNNDASMKWI